MQDQSEDQGHISLAKGTLKRKLIWRYTQISIYFISFIWALNTFGPKTHYDTIKDGKLSTGMTKWVSTSRVEGSTFGQIIGVVITLAICYIILNIINRTYMFQWVYKMKHTEFNSTLMKRIIK